MRAIDWAALICAAALLALISGYCLIAPWLSRINGNRFDRETPAFAALENIWWATHGPAYRKDWRNYPAAVEPAPRRWGVGEMFTRAAGWVAVKVLRADRTGARR